MNSILVVVDITFASFPRSSWLGLKMMSSLAAFLPVSLKLAPDRVIPLSSVLTISMAVVFWSSIRLKNAPRLNSTPDIPTLSFFLYTVFPASPSLVSDETV